jgi:hypothetical protein
VSARIAFLALFAIVAFPHSGHGQELTEKYIPVGAYAGLAGKFTTVGAIISVDERARTFTLKVDGGEQKFEVTDATKIWLDRSLLKQTNADGTFSVLKTGLKAEVSVFGPERMQVVKWVKVQITASR